MNIDFDVIEGALDELLDTVSFDAEVDGDVATDPNDPDEDDSGPEVKKLSAAQRAEFDAETERIKTNREGPGAKPHRFKAANWTHPNGHPRCILCGEEESIDRMCVGWDARKPEGKSSSFSPEVKHGDPDDADYPHRGTAHLRDQLRAAGLSPAAAERIGETLDRLTGRYGLRWPLYVENGAGVTNADGNPAVAYRDGSTLGVDADALGNKRLLGRLRREGWMVASDGAGVVTHEYGHAVVTGEARAAANAAARRWAHDHGADFVQLRGSLSHIARMNGSEADAEMFAAYELGGDNAPEWVRVWGDALRRALGLEAKHGEPGDPAYPHRKRRWYFEVPWSADKEAMMRGEFESGISVVEVEATNEVEARLVALQLVYARHQPSGGPYPPEDETLLRLIERDVAAGIKALVGDGILETKHGDKGDIDYPHKPRLDAIRPAMQAAPSGIGTYDESDRFPPELVAKMEKSLDDVGLDRETAADRLVAVAERSTTADEDGRWYADAHEQLHAIAERHGLTVTQTLGMTAAMSPLNEWAGNVADVEKLASTWDANPEVTISEDDRDDVLAYDRASRNFRAHPLDLSSYVGTHRLRDLPPNVLAAISARRDIGLPRGVGYRRNLEKALRIMAGEHPGDVLSGPKVRSFFSNLLVPSDDASVTVDTHMIRAMFDDVNLGDNVLRRVLHVPSAKTATGTEVEIGAYPLLAEAVRDAAARYAGGKFRPSEFQALVWRQWQREHPAQERRSATTKAVREGKKKRNKWQAERLERQKAEREALRAGRS